MLELEHGFNAVDVRVQLGGPGEPTAGRTASAETVEREMRHAGVARSLVAPAPGAGGEEGYVRANNAVARQAVDRPLAALARIDGPRDPGGGAGARLRNAASRREDHHVAPGDVEQFGYDDRFHGFALHPPTDGLPDEAVLEAVDDAGLPLFVFGGQGFPPTRVVESLLPRAVPVVLGHFGGHPLDGGLMDRAVGLLDHHDELHLDTAAVRYRSRLERAVREHPDRVLFGSGAPTVHPGVAVMEVLTLDVPEDAMARVLSGNAARLLESLELPADPGSGPAQGS